MSLRTGRGAGHWRRPGAYSGKNIDLAAVRMLNARSRSRLSEERGLNAGESSPRVDSDAQSRRSDGAEARGSTTLMEIKMFRPMEHVM